MKLTGKCLDAFKEWIKHKGLEKFYAKHYSLDISTAMYNAVLIDFFDSVGIRIGIDPYYDMQGTYRANIEHCGFQSMYRNVAIGMAIEKANEIFNLKNK